VKAIGVHATTIVLRPEAAANAITIARAKATVVVKIGITRRAVNRCATTLRAEATLDAAVAAANHSENFCKAGFGPPFSMRIEWQLGVRP
jgi:hypothetical protein